MEFNLADLFENAVDHWGDEECLVCDGQRRTFQEMEDRANCLAHHLQEHGIGAGDHVGIYALNCVEWVETLWAVFKIRAIWININYRYVEDELRYIFDNADLKAIVYQRQFGPRTIACRESMPELRHSVMIEDGSGEDCSAFGSAEYEEALAGASPERDFGPRSPDDLYMLYTGGTTGMPKGVVWRQEDVFFALGGGLETHTGWRAQKPEDMIEHGKKPGPQIFLSIAPLMHGATQWSVMSRSFVGGKNVLMSQFDPEAVWKLVAEEGVQGVMITGDAMGRPMADALPAALEKYDLSSLMIVTSSAAVFSPTVKDEFFEHLPNLLIIDGVGASEVGNNGVLICTKGGTQMMGGGPTFQPGEGTVVLDEELAVVEAGSETIGKIARSGNIPLGYYKDEKKTAEVYITGKDGRRYSMPGDFARAEADGSITLLGRGSVSINSGGEKIFPEEVESAIKSHPDAYDALVVGVPDERWGKRVAAVVQPREGTSIDLASIQEHCRTKIAGYKVPRELHLAKQIERAPSGKPDYRWALRVATGEIEG